MQRRDTFSMAGSIVFVAMICFPLLMWVSGFKVSAVDAEKRDYATFPTFQGSVFEQRSLLDFVRRVEVFFDDNFGLRRLLLSVHQNVMVRLFNESPTKRVLIGTDKWLYLGDGRAVTDFSGTDPYTLDQIDHWTSMYSQRKSALKKKGVEHLFVIVPNKIQLYPDYRPKKIQKVGERPLLRLLAAWQKTNFEGVLDLLPALNARPRTPALYYKTDHHWNDWGAFEASQAIVDSLRARLPKLRRLSREDYFLKTHPVEGGDLAQMMGMKSFYHEMSPRLHLKGESCVKEAEFTIPRHHRWEKQPPHKKPRATRCGKASLNAILFIDSFGPKLAKFLSPYFKRLVVIWDYPDRETLEQLVIREKPDLVIEERVERQVMGTR